MSLTSVMYHYVRPFDRTRHPGLKGRHLADFEHQLRYLLEQYQIVRLEDVVAAANGGAALPERACLLTFDDGYIDHYQYVFPILVRNGVQGSFFPPKRCVLDRKLLDVNKIHLILAATFDHAAVLDDVRAMISEREREFGLEPFDAYCTQYGGASRYDSPDTALLKRLLQKGLPEPPRGEIVEELFRRYVDTSHAVHVEELYFTVDQARVMARNGMAFGHHGAQHLWLDSLDPKEQAREVDEGLEFLTHIGVSDRDWVMCYPYGAWDDSLLNILRRRGCALGLTTKRGVADLGKSIPLLMPRMDTNDLPLK